MYNEIILKPNESYNQNTDFEWKSQKKKEYRSDKETARSIFSNSVNS